MSWAVLCCCLAACPGFADSLDRVAIERPSLNFYGTSGLMDMPSAEMQPDGEVGVTISHFGNITRNTLTFQFTPRFSGSFRYAAMNNWNDGKADTYYDRSFDIRYQILPEGPSWPAITVGLQDIAGTGIYAGEYVVATRHLGDTLTISGGIGWGRLGSASPFGAPFGTQHPEFSSGDTGGEFSVDQWFRGPAAFFGGLEWRPADRLGVKLEYASDAFREETERGLFTRTSPWNVGLEYQVNDTLRLGGYYMYGDKAGLTAQFSFNPGRPAAQGLRQTAPPAIVPRPLPQDPPGAWPVNWVATPGITRTIRDVVHNRLALQGQVLVGFALAADTVEIRIENNRYRATSQALGRAARVLTGAVPDSVETFRITLMDQGMALSTTIFRRADLEVLDHEPDAAEALRTRTRFAAAAPTLPGDVVDALYPRFGWSFLPYTRPSFFDPKNPFLIDVGLRLRGVVEFRPGWELRGAITQHLDGTLDRARMGESRLPRVRTNFARFEQNDTPVLETLTLTHVRALGQDYFGRITAGYLERMFAGLSVELLWSPVDSPLALGAEVNYAVQRDFDMRLGVQDYDVVTGHASIYYDFNNGYLAQIDVGRYLAGDWGATLTLQREFQNGWTIGAFATLTDVPARDFGEGSFDKGITVEIPLTWFTGQPGRHSIGTTIRPITRDGGARLDVPGRLYDRVRQRQILRIDDQWARVWR